MSLGGVGAWLWWAVPERETQDVGEVGGVGRWEALCVTVDLTLFIHTGEAPEVIDG